MPPGGSVTWWIGGIEAGEVVGRRSEGRGGRARAARGVREYAKHKYIPSFERFE